MSYCVHCGVELEPAASRCPLCGTPVVDPGAPGAEDLSTFFPTRPAQVSPVSKKELAILLSSMLLSVSVCCGLLNLILKPGTAWSLFVLGAAVMLWVWVVFPLLARWAPMWLRLTLDVGAVGIYVWLIALAVDGKTWFWGLAVPILVCNAVAVCIFGLLIRKKHSMLSTLTMLLAVVGAFCLSVELCCDRYFHRGIDLGWSLVVFACCVGLCVPLIVIRRVPSLRAEVRRRFHL